MTIHGQLEASLITDQDRAALLEAGRSLSHLPATACVRLEAEAEGGGRETFILPPAAVRMLADVLAWLGGGADPEGVSSDRVLTTQQAADMLNVSRPFLIRLLDEGRMPFHRVGTHRRIRSGDVAAYRHARDNRSAQALADLSREAQELGLGY